MANGAAREHAALCGGTAFAVPAAAMTGPRLCQFAGPARLPMALARPARERREIGHAFSDGMALAYRKTEGAGWEAQADGAGNAEIETRKR